MNTHTYVGCLEAPLRSIASVGLVCPVNLSFLRLLSGKKACGNYQGYICTVLEESRDWSDRENWPLRYHAVDSVMLNDSIGFSSSCSTATLVQSCFYRS